MSNATRSPLVPFLGVVALALFGLNFATWAHGQLNQHAERCAYPSEQYVAATAEAANTVIHVRTRAVAPELEAVRVLEREEIQHALSIAREHLESEAVRVQIEALAAQHAAEALATRSATAVATLR